MIDIRIDNKIRLDKTTPPRIVGALKAELNFINPLWEEAVANGRSTKGLLANIRLLQAGKEEWSIPRGCLDTVLAEVEEAFETEVEIHPPLTPLCLVPTPFIFHGKLKPNQRVAQRQILKQNYGVIQRPTGGGKTVIGLSAIAQRQTPTLILVHTERLLYQWKKAAEKFLGLKGKGEIGLIGDGNKTIGSHITVAIINSMYDLPETMWKELNSSIGFLVVDECHRVPSETFAKAVSKFTAPYLLGLSATVYRSDGLDKLINYYLGKTVHKVSIRRLQELGEIMVPKLRLLDSPFFFKIKSPRDYQKMIKALTRHEGRNKLIAESVRDHSKTCKGTPLVVSQFKSHLDIIAKEMDKLGMDYKMMVGETSPKKRDDTIEYLLAHPQVPLLATGQLIGEGYDMPSLSALFMTFPIKFEGRVIQYVGRILRIEEGKETPIIYDFNDAPWLLQHSLKRRLAAYEECGATI